MKEICDKKYVSKFECFDDLIDLDEDNMNSLKYLIKTLKYEIFKKIYFYSIFCFFLIYSASFIWLQSGIHL